MKRLINLFSVIALFCGCQKFAETENLVVKTPVSNSLPEVIYAYMAGDNDEENSTRTYIENYKSISWQEDDAISYFAGTDHNVKYQYNSENSATENKFTKVQETGNTSDNIVNKSFGVYPYDSRITFSHEGNSGGNNFVVYYPEVQNYAPNSFGKGANLMLAVNAAPEANNLYFRNMCGYLLLKLYGKDITIKSIKLTGNKKETIAGKASIQAWTDGKINIYRGGEDVFFDVTLDCGDGVKLGADAEHATEFWFALRPETFEEGFTIEITDPAGNAVTKKTSKKVVIERNKIQPMSAFSVEKSFEDYKLYYTRANNAKNPVAFGTDTPFDAEITKHDYDSEKGMCYITFKTKPTTIKENAFKEKDITLITIPESVTTIEASAFEGSNLLSITIPKNVKSIGKNALSYCKNLRTIDIEEGDTPLSIEVCNYGYFNDSSKNDGSPFFHSPLSKIILKRDINYKKDSNDFTVNLNNEGIFYTNPNLNVGSVTVELGGKLTKIDTFMFNSLNIESITIPATVTSVGIKAFWNCDKLETVTLNNSTLGSNMFEDCDKLNKVIFGGTFTSINGDCFSNFSELEITGSVGTISENAFKGFNITTLNISGSVNTIGDYAFRNCDELTTATLSGTTVGKGVFYDCDKLEVVTIDGSVNSIGNDAFYSCPSIKKVTFLPSPTATDLVLGYQTYGTAEEGPFKDSNLKEVDWNRNISYTLYNNNGLNQYDEGIFSQNSNLTKVTIGEQVKTILPYTFAETAITTITLPKNYVTIGSYAFAKCNNLTTVYYHYGYAPTIREDAFKDCKNNVTFIEITE